MESAQRELRKASGARRVALSAGRPPFGRGRPRGWRSRAGLPGLRERPGAPEGRRGGRAAPRERPGGAAVSRSGWALVGGGSGRGSPAPRLRP